MSKFDEAEFKLHSVVHEITKDEREPETKSIYNVIDDLRFIKDTLQSAKALETEHEALKKELAKSVGYCSKIQNELNTLKNDVARYFELLENQYKEDYEPDDYLFNDDWRELNFLHEKLSKVGKEE